MFKRDQIKCVIIQVRRETVHADGPAKENALLPAVVSL